MALATIGAHHWTRQDYERMVADGLFQPEERVELIEGVIYNRSPQSSRHSTAVHVVAEALRRAFPQHYLRIQAPLALGDLSAPEPDLAVVPGQPRDYRDGHPNQALLVVEVADSSLLHDRQRKVPLYAEAGIPETWILNLVQGTLEVYREPGDTGYRSSTTLGASESVQIVAAESPLSIPVGDLLP
jgi:Uma2 family endonuclease